MMNSTIVSKQITKVIKPLLVEQGFKVNRSRTFWRHTNNRIDIINFQSYGAYRSDPETRTSFSYFVNFGVYLPYVGRAKKIEVKNGLLLPDEVQAYFRNRLTAQNSVRNALEELWFIDQEGKYLDEVIFNTHAALKNFGFNWFNRFDSLESILAILLNEENESDGTWGYGNTDSPARFELLGNVYAQMGDKKNALKYIEKVIEQNNGFIKDFKKLDSDTAGYFVSWNKDLKAMAKKLKD